MKTWDWKSIGIIVAIAAAAGTFGLVMPWSAASKTEVADLKKTNDSEHKELRTLAEGINGRLSRMEGQLDIIVKSIPDRKE